MDTPGLRGLPGGGSVLSGPLLELAEGLDAAFERIAASWDAERIRFPPTIPAATLERVDYLRSFPHLATFAAPLSPGSLDAFAGGGGLGPSGAVDPGGLAPARDVLTPAACYHLYTHLEGERLTAPRVATFRATCFRHEEAYEPLRRQWAFTMREIVCVGSREEVVAFLDRARPMMESAAEELSLPVRWVTATDPFFRPARDPASLAQRLNPTKSELDLDGLAIASANLHQDHFGAAFDIRRSDAPAFSGCVAFGIERWCWAVLTRHGTDPAAWPSPARDVAVR